MGRFGQLLNTTTGLSVCLILLTFSGAFIFNQIEGTAEVHTRIQAAKSRQKIFLIAQQLAEEGEDADWSKLVSQVDRYRDKLRQAWKAGNDELGVALQPPSWSFWGSVYYCITLFTTIGYGNVFPNTNLGRLVTIAYGLLAIPLCTMVLSRVSKEIARILKSIYLMTLDSSGIPVGLRDAYTRADSKFEFSFITTLGLVIVYFALSGVVYCWGIKVTADEWSPLEAVYFSFISMTSIGLGDLVPTSDVFLNIVSLIYIFIGLAIMNLFFGRIVEILETFLSKLSSTSSNEYGDGTETSTSRYSRRPHALPLSPL